MSIQLIDHPSLAAKSSAVRFRGGNAVRVYDEGGTQLLLEESCLNGALDDDLENNTGGRHEPQNDCGKEDEIEDVNSSHTIITIKRTSTATYGLYFLRGLYTSMAFLMSAVVFVFFIGVLLFLCVDLAHHVHDDLTDNRVFMALAASFGTILSIPVLVRGLTSTMSLLTRFVVEVFSGGQLFRIFGLSSVVVDWVSFCVFIATSFAAMIGSLFAGSQTVLYNTTVTALVSLASFFIGFALLVVYHRVSAALYFIQELGARSGVSTMTIWGKIRQLILVTLRQRLSGKVSYLIVRTTDEIKVASDNCQEAISKDDESSAYRTVGSWYVRFTKLHFLRCFFETLDEPRRLLSRDEVNGNIPYLTDRSWSLEGLFCRSRTQSFIAVVGGPAALSSMQLRSGRICVYMGLSIYLLILVGVCVWIKTPPIIPAVAALFFAAWCWFAWIRNIRRVKEVYQDAIAAHKEGSFTEQIEKECATCLCQIWRTYLVTRPTETFLWFYFLVHTVVFFFFPFIYLCVDNNWPMVALFAMTYVIYSERQYFDANSIIEELGDVTPPVSTVEENELKRNERETKSMILWKTKSRKFHIESIDSQASLRFWDRIFYAFLVLLLVIVCAAAFSSRATLQNSYADLSDIEDPNALDPWMTFPAKRSYYYGVSRTQSYPMCQLGGNNRRKSIAPVQYLADYAFLSNIPYFKAETLHPLLYTWFGGNQVFVEKDAVTSFLQTFPEMRGSHASFQLLSFPDRSAIVLVRGTKTTWDFLTDAQLWYSPMLFQIVRGILPLGNVFNDLIRVLIGAMSGLEKKSLKDIAYYKATTAFVNFLKAERNYTDIEITGHSLGGGIALITGAQTHIRAVGLSAPNAVLGRHTVDPEITLEELENYNFNIAPRRDIFPMIGDPSPYTENIACRASSRNFFSCHEAARSLCEMLYSCGGSVRRPVFCECVSKFDYPPPEIDPEDGTGVSFAEACGL